MKYLGSKYSKFFGTDGIRGVPGVYPLTDGMIFKIGLSIAKFVLYKENRKEFSKIVIARDTRISGTRIETILTDAVNSYGIDVLSAGIITTAGLSFLVKNLNADMGVMISASHNNPDDNGIILFNAEGFKLLENEEEWIENIIFNNIINRSEDVELKKRGNVYIIRKALSKYMKFLMSTAQGLNLEGICVALDCGWGASSVLAAPLLKKLGASVISINDSLSGENINSGGAVDPSELLKLTLESKADLGVAFDGDGDRVVLIDEKGNILDGDVIMAIIARYFLERDKLPKKTIVATEMSNRGLKVCLEESGAEIIFTKVGDKYVLEKLIKEGLNLGGEQSGKIIFKDYLPVSEGLLTAFQVLKVMNDTNSRLSELSQCIEKVPQVLINVKVREKRPFEDIPMLCEKIDLFNSRLQDDGRILLRYSGTENVARVMVEGAEKDLIENMADSLAELIEKEIGITAELVDSKE